MVVYILLQWLVEQRYKICQAPIKTIKLCRLSVYGMRVAEAKQTVPDRILKYTCYRSTLREICIWIDNKNILLLFIIYTKSKRTFY